MIYIRKIFKQDLRDGKQIAFVKEASNVFFNFNYTAPDPDRKISFKYIENNVNSPYFHKNGKIINTRIYAAGSESRIDGELKLFLKNSLDAKIDDIIVFRAINIESYEFEFIHKDTLLYDSYKNILNGKNHEVALEQDNNDFRVSIEEQIDFIKSNKIRKFVFDVFKFIVKEFGTDFIQINSAIRKSKLGMTSYNSYLFPDYFQTKSIMGSFDEEQSEESLKSSNTLRYFSENLEILDQKHIYFTTQWDFPQFQHSPSFISFNQFVLDYSENKYKIVYDDNTQFYKLVLNNIQEEIHQIKFDLNKFQLKAALSGLIFSHQLITRFIASLCTKPFVICSGLSGSGKTKLAQAFVQWISENEKQYKIIPVGADWTNREPLIGYPNGLEPTSYVSPDSGALQLILEASKEENKNKPYFMILDEMNLSHVERYFADFLSIMESGDSIKLYSGADRKDSNDNKIVQEICWPKNLFIIGTVNIDETTYMFSPKVLDRANVIEFRISPKEMNYFFENRIALDMKKLFLDEKEINGGAGQSMGESFFKMAEDKSIVKIPEIESKDNILNKFFSELQIMGSEFGYRSATEIELLITKLGIDELLDKKGNPISNNTKVDIAIMQKLLPKLHGSRNKLTKVLPVLGGFCLTDNSKIRESYLDKFVSNSLTEVELKADTNIKYKISFEKICRMYKNAVENGFASYAEA